MNLYLWSSITLSLISTVSLVAAVYAIIRGDWGLILFYLALAFINGFLAKEHFESFFESQRQ